MEDGAEGTGKAVNSDHAQGNRMERLFLYINRVNSILLLVALILLGAYSVWAVLIHYQWHEDYDHVESGFDRGNDAVEGESIQTSEGQIIAYTIAPIKKAGRDISGANLSFTNMRSGKSRLILPEESEQVVLNWETLESRTSGAVAYSVVVGTEQDFEDGILDWIVGRYSDLEQVTLARRVRYIDAPQMIDDVTMSVIVWTTQEKAEFWLVDLSKLAIISKRDVELPLPTKDLKNSGASASAADVSDAVAESFQL